MTSFFKTPGSKTAGADRPAETAEPDRSTPDSLSSDEIQAYVVLGRRLRSEAMARCASKMMKALIGDRAERPPAVLGVTSPRDVVSHNLRTPLTSIRANSELLIDNPDMPQEHRTRFLSTIHEEALRLERAIDVLMGSTRPRQSTP